MDSRSVDELNEIFNQLENLDYMNMSTVNKRHRELAKKRDDYDTNLRHSIYNKYFEMETFLPAHVLVIRNIIEHDELLYFIRYADKFYEQSKTFFRNLELTDSYDRVMVCVGIKYGDRDINRRLGGKRGLIRNNMMGMTVSYTGRTVVNGTSPAVKKLPLVKMPSDEKLAGMSNQFISEHYCAHVHADRHTNYM